MIYTSVMIITFSAMLFLNLHLIIENKKLKERAQLWRDISDSNANQIQELVKFAVETSSEIGSYEKCSDNVVQFRRY